ncbi:hypothetical protein L5515_004438 [Caenorhabditis briggsae]|uniref:EF-hand domain-containing protein n=1 Tax=Caenorhabditis briggsae TaxID=6238 RepID=A0AAE9EKS7_CAEBR|nr:hypothetical protein L5515_004438 [Caenorhabditis briggsae]
MRSEFANEEVVREISGRRVHVLQKFVDFENKAINKRELLLQSCKLQLFLRSSRDFVQIVDSLIETAESIHLRHDPEHLARAQKILGRLRGEVDGKRHSVPSLEREADALLENGHYAAEDIQKTISDVRSRWEHLLQLLKLKQLQVQTELESIDFGRKCSSILDWMTKTKAIEHPSKQIFDEIRKYAFIWNEISATYQQFPEPSSIDTENFESVRDIWYDFQQYVDAIHRELDDNERLQKFVDNAEHLNIWMRDKEREIHDKYSNLNVEEAMKYRKTIDIEIKSTEQRIKDLKEQATDPNSNENFQNHPELLNQVVQVEKTFKSFQKYIQKWRSDLEFAAELDTLLKEAENIRFWCSEKVENLQVMEQSDSVDCDEIAMWIETNNFDFKSWDSVVDQFVASAEKLLVNGSDEDIEKEVEKIKSLYSQTKEESKACNELLKIRMETISLEILIYQTHQKASHLVSVLQKNEDINVLKVEDAETELRMLTGVAVRCASVIEQIETIEYKIDQNRKQLPLLSSNANEQLEELSTMKSILESSPEERTAQLKHFLDAAHIIENCRDIRKHIETIWQSLQEGRKKRDSTQPLKEQVDSLMNEMQVLNLNDDEKIKAEDELTRAKKTLEQVEVEQDRLTKQSNARREAKKTEKFVERVHQWMEDSLKDDDETDFSSHNQNLHSYLANNKHLVSTANAYKDSIEKKRAGLTETDDYEQKCLLDGIQNALENFNEQVLQKIDDTENRIKSSQRLSELHSQNDWIRVKIRSLSVEPIWDSLLIAQKMNRRYEKDSEEIESRRKHINEIVTGSVSVEHQPILDEIENNWSRMKAMFDERGGILERMIKLYEYDEESNTTSEWLGEKMMYADAMEPKEDETFNKVMVKKLEALADEVESYKPKIVENHALLEDALVTPKTKDSVSQQVIKLKSALTRKQGEIESDYVALKRMVDKKLENLRTLLQDADIIREIGDMERWIEEEGNLLNRCLAADSEELPMKIDDVMANVQRRRSNLTDIKCSAMGGGQLQTQKVDDAFDMLDIFSFEVDRIKQKASRSALFKKLKTEAEDVIDAIQETQERIDSYPSLSRKNGVFQELPNLDGDLETLRRRVVASLDKAKEVRAANADLAPQVYDLEERIEKEWTDVSKAAENRKKRMERGKLFADLENELLDMEHWVDTFNEKVIVVIGDIHDALGVQVGLESIDTWREELSHRVDQLNDVKNGLASVLNTIPNQDQRNEWLERVSNIESDLVKARQTIDAKQDELSEFSHVLVAERNCERLFNWAVNKREKLELDAATCNAKTVIRKMNEVEKMMISRAGEVDELRDFLEKLKESNKPSTFKSTELGEKFERLDDEWRYLEEELKRKERDLNESMSQLLLDEQFEKIQQWIEERTELLEGEKSTENKPSDIERRQKQYEKLASEINEYLPVYEDFLTNDHIEHDKVHIIREMWSSLIETTTIHQKSLAQEVQKNRLRDLLDDIGNWLTDSETEVHSFVNFTTLYNNVDAEKASRRLKSLNEQAGEKDDLLRRVRQDGDTKEIVEKLKAGISELKLLIKANYEDLEVWKNMQDIVKSIDDEICWYKEISVIVSTTDVGHDSSSLEVIRRKHQRLLLESERRKQKVSKIVDRTTELMSGPRRPSLDSKIDEIDEKLAQLTELLENNNQIAKIRTNRLEKWAEYFIVIDEIREKEHVLDQICIMKNGSQDAVLAEVERKCGLLKTIGDQMDTLKQSAEAFTNDEIIRSKAAENAVEKLRVKWLEVVNMMEEKYRKLKEAMDSSKFAWKCDTANHCIRDQEEKISNLVRQQKPTSNFEVAAYHATTNFVETYTNETIEKLTQISGQLPDPVEADRKLATVLDRLSSLKKQLELLAEKIDNDGQRKRRIQSIQDDYSKRACELGNWLEQAEEEVSDVVWFQTKESSEDCRHTLIRILELLRNDKAELLGELELLEVELAELNEDVSTFTWHSYESLASRMERLDQTITDRVRVVDGEINRHMENEKICEDAASCLQMCRNVILEVKKEINQLHNMKLDDQRDKLMDLIEKVQGSGMVRELEKWRSLMGSRYIFSNKFSSATPHGVLVEACHCLELMSSMLRSVEQSISERNSSGVTEKQIREFELAFEYFDREKKGWLDYEHFELCIKSQGYDFSIETATSETMKFLDPTNSGRILKTEYMRWMVKNETTNILDDHSAIEDALKSLDARKISDFILQSMSRKEAEFFMRKIAMHTETFTEHVHLEYKDFVDSFY